MRTALSFAQCGSEQSAGASYVLELGGDLAWNLVSTPHTARWLGEFARALGLSQGHREALARITFCKTPSGGYFSGDATAPGTKHTWDDLTVHGWDARNLTVTTLWSGPDDDDLVFQLHDIGSHRRELLMMWQSLHFAYDKVLDQGGLPLHAALVDHQGRGILLAGRGGSGKSTSCRRLPDDWNVHCDDETLIVADASSRYAAHPLPTWNDMIIRGLAGKWTVSSRVPLRAIFYVERCEVDQLVPLGRGEAAVRISQSSGEACFRQLQYLTPPVKRSWQQRTFANACQMVGSIPVFLLRMTSSGSFWRNIEEVLDSI